MRQVPAIGLFLGPATAAVGAGRRFEREAWRAVTRRLGDAGLATLEAFLASGLAGEAVDRVVDSELPRRVAARALADGVVEAAAARMFDGPELERVVEAALESPASERLLVRVIESSLLDQAVERLLMSEELWVAVDEIARSPAVAEAIAQQGMGFADQVAGGVRTRSRRADDWLERAARRTLRLEQSGRRPPGPDSG